MAGYDQSHYVNNLYPWEGKMYRRPAYTLFGSHKWEGMFSEAGYNPVGSYIREFDLEKELLCIPSNHSTHQWAAFYHKSL